MTQAAFNFTVWLVSSMTYALVAVARVDVPYKWIFAILPLLMPHGGEVFGTLTNIQWHYFTVPPMEDLHWRDRVEALQGDGEIPINPPDWTTFVFIERQPASGK